MENFLDALFTLKGRTAVVTGGSSGIGRSIATALCRAGAEVVVVARRPEPLQETADALRDTGGAASWLTADLGDRQSVHRLADQLQQRHGRTDILVNSAGVNIRLPLEELSEEDWDRTLRTNLDAPFLLGQRLGPAMAENGWGRILHIASQQSVRAFGNSGAYGVSKAGLTALTRSQAEAWSARGVCVNAIAPGFVHTPLNEAVFRDPVRTAAMARRTMTGRNGELADFAGIAVFLAGDAAAYVTGQTIFVDGGFSVT
ncbi:MULTISPECIES: SDR family NAD(P)-dependent oxidoreductase [Streptomyces]|uniref:Dehydrogenase n=2 Tax=Streptomyces TaxID=1883 RepID=A0A2N8PGE7_STRNR|nr:MULTISPECIES: SDR family oxidoreductase [Streptomyces]PNE40115.1 dehydrogenase [Streptomyces noursei]SHL36188.1 gluconate 5-dehydrogenase [Streptomyces yunnanensis]